MSGPPRHRLSSGQERPLIASRASSASQPPHYRPSLGPARDFLESRAAKQISRALIGEEVGSAAALGLHGVTFNDFPSAFPYVLNRSLEQTLPNPSTPLGPGDKETDDRPDRLVIHGFKDSGTLESRELLAWCHRNPADWLSVAVRYEAGNAACPHNRFHSPAVGLALIGAVLLRGLTPPHTPAAAGSTVPAEELLEIGPA